MWLGLGIKIVNWLRSVGPSGPFGGHATLADDLVSYWKLDEVSGVRYDAVVASANDLTDNNTVTSATGVRDLAAEFTAANSEWLSRASGNTALDNTFTVSMWLNVGATTRFGVLHNGSGVGTYGFAVECSVFAAGDLFVVHRDDGGDFSYTAGGVVTTDNSAYQLVIFTYDTATTPKLHVYVNDVDKALTLGVAFPVLGIGSASLLGRRSDTPRFFTGKQDEVGIWSRVLTAQERTDLYNGGAGLFY